MKHLTIESLVGMEALEAYDSNVAVEAFSLKAVANRAIDVIPNLSHAFNEVLSSYKGDKYDLKPLSVNRVVLARTLKTADFLSIGKFNVYVPQGFIGNYKEYLTVFTQALLFSNGIITRMTQFNQLVSALITDGNTRRSTKDLSIATADMEAERQGIRQALAPFTKEGSRSDRAALQTVFASLGEIDQCVDLAGDILFGIQKVSLDEVTKLTNDASELLRTLGEQAVAGKVSDLSPEAYRSLSSATLTMARDVELFSLLMDRTYQIKKSLEHTSEELIKALRY